MAYYNNNRKPPKRRRALKLVLGLIVIAGIVAGYVYYALNRPLTMVQPVRSSLRLQTATGNSAIIWPTAGQAAVAVAGSTILESHGKQTSVPIASTAKVITALVVLQKKPLSSGAAGKTSPIITLGPADVDLYYNYIAQEGSVVPVSDGEQITEYQILEAMMLPSANNLADSLAIWAYGSQEAYKAAATQYVASLGLKDTVVGADASGFSPSSTSSAHDLVIIGNQAMQNPVLRQIVGQTSANDIPGLDDSQNVNFLLGTNGIIGIKTGNTDQAGGVYLSASVAKVDGQPTTIITALVGAPTLFQALQNSLPMITSAQANFVTSSLLKQNAVVGEYRLPWGGIVSAAINSDLTSSVWRGGTASAIVSLQPINVGAQAGQIVGAAASAKTPFSAGNKTAVVLLNAPTQPNIWWRLLHPLN